MNSLKGWENAIRSNFPTAENPNPVLHALRAGYLFALQTPHNVVRIRNQQTLCLLRDSIAELEGRDPEEVQNEFEELALLARQELKPEPVVFESWHTLYPCRSHGKNTLHIGGNYNTRKSAEDWATNHRTLQIHPEEAYILHLTITDGVPHAKFIPYSPK